MLMIWSSPFAAQKQIRIEANPFLYLSARLKVLGKCDDDSLDQLDLA